MFETASSCMDFIGGHVNWDSRVEAKSSAFSRGSYIRPFSPWSGMFEGLVLMRDLLILYILGSFGFNEDKKELHSLSL